MCNRLWEPGFSQLEREVTDKQGRRVYNDHVNESELETPYELMFGLI